MHAVVRNDHETFHVFGQVDGANVSSLQYHAESMGHDGHVCIFIEVTPSEERVLQRQAGPWLDRLARTGTLVRVQTVGWWALVHDLFV
jgi:hypothetical protein